MTQIKNQLYNIHHQDILMRQKNSFVDDISHEYQDYIYNTSSMRFLV